MPDALIFDIDGTLLESVDLHARAWQEALRHFGHDIKFETIRSQIGKGGDQLLPYLLGEKETERQGKQIEEFRGNLFKQQYLPKVKPFPKVRELFLKIQEHHQKVALASSAKADEIKRYEEIAQIDDLVETEVSSAQAEKSKPHPDIIEASLARLGGGIDRKRVLMIGDSPYDVEAARHAGLSTVCVRCGGFPEADLRDAGCLSIYQDPADLLSNYERSPLA